MKPRPVPPHTVGAGYTCRACERPHIPGCIRDRDASCACPNLPSADPSAPVGLDVPRLVAFLLEQADGVAREAALREKIAFVDHALLSGEAQLRALAAALPALAEDRALLDALDARRELLTSGRQPIAHAWGVYGHCETVREALRALLPAPPAVREQTG